MVATSTSGFDNASARPMRPLSPAGMPFSSFFHVVQAEIGPRGAAVGRAVDAAAPGRALAIVVLAGSGPDDVRVAREDREGTERVVGLPLEDRLPGDALVRRFPDAAARGRDVEDRGISGIDLEIVNASARCGGSDVSEMQTVERRPVTLRARALRGERAGERKRNQNGGDDR